MQYRKYVRIAFKCLASVQYLSALLKCDSTKQNDVKHSYNKPVKSPSRTMPCPILSRPSWNHQVEQGWESLECTSYLLPLEAFEGYNIFTNHIPRIQNVFTVSSKTYYQHSFEHEPTLHETKNGDLTFHTYNVILRCSCRSLGYILPFLRHNKSS